MLARVIDEMHVVNAGRTRGHARETREAAIEMLHCGCVCRAVLLQHVLGEIDAPARTIQLVSGEQVGGTRGGAEPAMNAGPQNAVALRNLRVRELGR